MFIKKSLYKKLTIIIIIIIIMKFQNYPIKTVGDAF